MRIALFGGTFDPPHRGHLSVARVAADRFRLDSVLFAPVGRQPLKLHTVPSSYEDRLAMVSLACAASGDERFVVSACDAPRPDGQPNYTVDTLTRMVAAHPDATLFSLVGADSFSHLGHWREPERLLSLAEWIVISRPGFALQAPANLELSSAQEERVHLLDEVHDEVSATALRGRLNAGEPCLDLISASVQRYVEQHRLYRNECSATTASGGPAT